MRKLELRGIIPSMVTPFDSNGRVDLDALRHEAAYLEKAGVHGLCVGGVISETAGSSAEEIHLLCKTVVSVTEKPVIAGIFPDCNIEAFELAGAALSAGAVGLLVAPPHYLFSPDREGLMEMFATLRRRVTVPVFLSNCIPTAQVGLDSITGLMERGLIDGIHQAGGNTHLLADVLRLDPRVPVYTGVEDLLFMAFLLGAEGAVSALAAVFPQDCLALYEAVGQNSLLQARGVHERLLRLWRALDHPFELLSRVKWALALQGRQRGVPRSPYSVESFSGLSLVREALEKQGKISPS